MTTLSSSIGLSGGAIGGIVAGVGIVVIILAVVIGVMYLKLLRTPQVLKTQRSIHDERLPEASGNLRNDSKAIIE